jgi:hypothetical protein
MFVEGKRSSFFGQMVNCNADKFYMIGHRFGGLDCGTSPGINLTKLSLFITDAAVK